MADSNVDVTEGSGKSIDTRTESTNGNHRQVVVLGDPSTNSGIAPVDATNGLKVDVSNTSLTVDLGANNDVTVTGDALTSLQLIDDIVKTDDAAFTPATDKVAMVGAEFDDTTPDSVDEGDAGALRMSARRELYVQLRDAAGNERGLNVDTNGDIGVTTPLDGALDGSELQVDVVAPLPAGTNAIGKLSANSGVDIGDVDVTSQPARDRTTDNIGVALQTDVIMNDTTELTPKFAVIDDATSGNNTLVAAVASKKIRVLACFMVSAGDVNARFESGADGTALTGQMNLTTNSGFVLPFNPAGWFETASNTLLNLELSDAISVDGSLVYVEV